MQPGPNSTGIQVLRDSPSLEKNGSICRDEGKKTNAVSLANNTLRKESGGSLLVCNNAGEEERKISLFVVVNPRPPPKGRNDRFCTVAFPNSRCGESE